MFNPVFSWIDRLHQVRTELVAEHIRIETQRMFDEGMILSLKLQLRRNISKELADRTQSLRATIAAQQKSLTNWQGIANDLRESAAGSVRSISHRLWGQLPPTSFPDLTASEITQLFFSQFVQHKEVLMELESKIDESKIQALSTGQLTLRFSKDLATYLHGNLQSRLMATAFAIEIAGANSNHVELSAQLEVALQAIEKPFDHFFETPPKPLTAEITNLIEHWGPLLSITLVFSGSDQQFSLNESRAILSCIEEGLANALHHGYASEVVLSIETTPTMHVISLTDNGFGPTLGMPGLGSSLFTSCAGSNWSLCHGPDGIGAKLILQITK